MGTKRDHKLESMGADDQYQSAEEEVEQRTAVQIGWKGDSRVCWVLEDMVHRVVETLKLEVKLEVPDVALCANNAVVPVDKKVEANSDRGGPALSGLRRSRIRPF